jgi:hypothetical protein
MLWSSLWSVVVVWTALLGSVAAQNAAADVFEVFRRAAIKPVVSLDSERRAADAPVIAKWREQNHLDGAASAAPPTTATTQPSTTAVARDSPFVHKACDVRCAVAATTWLALPLQAPPSERFVVEIQVSVTEHGERVDIERLRQTVLLRLSAQHVAAVDDAEHGALIHAELRLRGSELNEIQLAPLPAGPLWHFRFAFDLATSSIGVAVANKTHIIAPHNSGGEWRFATRHAVPLLLRSAPRDALTFWFRVSHEEAASTVRVCVREVTCTEWLDSVDSVAFLGGRSRPAL